MTTSSPFAKFSMNDKEKELFEFTLASNPHLTETNHIALYAWIKLSVHISNMGDTITKEDLRFIAEHRLLSNSLRLNPKSVDVQQGDISQYLKGVVNDV